jgi:hypothetical protein
VIARGREAQLRRESGLDSDMDSEAPGGSASSAGVGSLSIGSDGFDEEGEGEGEGEEEEEEDKLWRRRDNFRALEPPPPLLPTHKSIRSR